jgi:hypothetical protein
LYLESEACAGRRSDVNCAIHARKSMPSVTDLRRLVEERRRSLAEAEAALEAALNRTPVVGDFVQSTLTHFYGRVSKVTTRPMGRPWVEITPYLTPTLPGRSTLDLYDDWEIIDDPSTRQEADAAQASGEEIVSRLTDVIVSFAPLKALGTHR